MCRLVETSRRPLPFAEVALASNPYYRITTPLLGPVRLPSGSTAVVYALRSCSLACREHDCTVLDAMAPNTPTLLADVMSDPERLVEAGEDLLRRQIQNFTYTQILYFFALSTVYQGMCDFAFVLEFCCCVKAIALDCPHVLLMPASTAAAAHPTPRCTCALLHWAVVFVWLFQRTIGKAVCGIRVASVEAGPITLVSDTSTILCPPLAATLLPIYTEPELC